MSSAHLTPEIAAREAEFSQRVARLLGLSERAGLARIGIDEVYGKAPVLTAEVVISVTTEEALRLRYGDDAVVTRTGRGWTVEFPTGAP